MKITLEKYSKLQDLFGVEFNVKETLSQLTYGSNRSIKVMSWGVRGFTNMSNKGLLFRVSGFKHKGYVLITLNVMDTYDVYLLKLNFDVKEAIDGIYAEDLTDLIDNHVEYLDDYDSRVKEYLRTNK